MKTLLLFCALCAGACVMSSCEQCSQPQPPVTEVVEPTPETSQDSSTTPMDSTIDEVAASEANAAQ